MPVSDLVYFRPCGDALSLKFNEEGTLSTAYLMMEGSEENVSSFFPGLTIENCDTYLKRLGYLSAPSECEEICRGLQKKGIYVTYCRQRSSGRWLMGMVSEDKRLDVCGVVDLLVEVSLNQKKSRCKSVSYISGDPDLLNLLF